MSKSKIAPITSDHTSTIYMGADPEFFFSKDGKVVGAEKIIPKEGLLTNNYGNNNNIKIDGIQAEINPPPDTCREALARNIGFCFLKLTQEMKKDKEIKIDFTITKKLTKKELEEISEENKQLGCTPSLSTYKSRSLVIKNPSLYQYRSAGGHIHLGEQDKDDYMNHSKINKALKNPERLVPILDILVGNTCVLIDKDPNNKIRRRNYGRAGEYRTPDHGLEYRTLSNFWLKNYTLMSFVMSLARQAVVIVAHSTTKNNYEKMLRKKANMRDIKRAINNNDTELARKNFNKICPVISEIMQKQYGKFPLTKNSIPLFNFFAAKTLKSWFKADPVKHWESVAVRLGRHNGWESFLYKRVTPRFEKANNLTLLSQYD